MAGIDYCYQGEWDVSPSDFEYDMEGWDDYYYWGSDDMGDDEASMMKMMKLVEMLMMDPEDAIEEMMEEMACMSNDDCKDTPMKGLMSEFVAGDMKF